MEIKRHETSKRMSKAVITDGVAYLCGQVAGEYTDDIKDQTRKTLKRVEDILHEIGSDKDHILQTQIFLARREDFNGMNEVWEEFVNEGCAPARATVCVDFPNQNILVEMVVIAKIK